MNSCLTLYIKINPRGIAQLIVKSKAINILEENLREYLYNREVCKMFLNDMNNALIMTKIKIVY